MKILRGITKPRKKKKLGSYAKYHNHNYREPPMIKEKKLLEKKKKLSSYERYHKKNMRYGYKQA